MIERPSKDWKTSMFKRQTVVAIRGVCYSHEAHLNTFSSDRPCLSAILPFPLFSLQVSFKGNYQGLVDLSKTTVGRYSSFWFEHESYKGLYNNHVYACALIGQSALVYVQPINLCSIAWKEEGTKLWTDFSSLIWTMLVTTANNYFNRWRV